MRKEKFEVDSSFWENSARGILISEFGNFQQRKTAWRDFISYQNYMTNPNQKRSLFDENGNLNVVQSYFDLLKGKKLWADEVKFKGSTDFETFKSVKNGIAPPEAANNEVFKSLIKQLDNQKQIKLLQMFYDLYVAPLNSDAAWRIGNTTATIEQIGLNDEKIGSLIQGKAYTRSNMSLLYDWNYLSGDSEIYSAHKFYTATLFPPFKIGPRSYLGQKTSLMENVADYTFDQDNFTVEREGFTYRDISMKSLSDYINYLQWIAEGVTGIVSTYLTEWDLSLYIQEGLMAPQPNGNPCKIYLNYRIYEDNPMANPGSSYSDDRALSFNVCGSSVSKLEFDCMKQWIPADYPLSTWWMPYKQGADWYLKSTNLTDDWTIYYMSIYDDTDSDYAYDSQSDIRNIFKNQDYLGMIFGTKPRMDLSYYEAFYTTHEDGLSDFDVKVKNILKKVSGASYGVSTLKAMDKNALIQAAKKEMIMNGGYQGGPQQVGNSGGYLNRMAIEFAMTSNDDKMSSSKMANAAMQSVNTHSDSNISDLNQQSTEANSTASSILSTEKCTSVMSDLTGINRWAPAIYGGPHGSEYSPLNIRSWFDQTSATFRNIPRTFIESFNDENSLYTNVEQFYKNDDKINACGSQSPGFNVTAISGGIFEKRYKLVKRLKEKENIVYADMTYIYDTGKFQYSWPKRIKGYSVNYNGSKIKYKTEVRTMTIKELTKGTFWGWLLNLNVFTRYFIMNKRKTFVIQRPYRKAIYKQWVYEYDVEVPEHDLPDTTWTIVQHKFGNFTASNDQSGTFWKLLRKAGHDFEAVENYAASNKPGFILRVSPNEENEILNKITTKTSNVFFCQNNDKGNAIKSIFAAPVKKDYYVEVKWVIVKSLSWLNVFLFLVTGNFLFWFWPKKSHLQPVYTYHPYIEVDLMNAKYMFDNLDRKPETNMSYGSAEMPLHLNSSYTLPIEENRFNPMQALSAGFYDTMYGSTATMGLSGKGILSGIQGLPIYSNKKTQFGEGNRYTPFKKAVVYTRSNGAVKPNKQLTKAVQNIWTSLKFWPYKKDKYIKIDLSVPYRNFLSLCVTQQNYMKLFSQVINTIDFKYIHDSLVNNVDRCVLQACGLHWYATKDASGELDGGEDYNIVQADKKHILYNYWIDKGIQMFGSKSKDYNSYQNEMIAKVNEFNTTLNNIINVFKPICTKNTEDWCFDNLEQMNKQIYYASTVFNKRNVIDDFMFVYLNILYYYRLFFIGKRFNKQSGTMWSLRAIESVLDMAISLPEEGAKPPAAFEDSQPPLAVAFYELQNTLKMKKEVTIDPDSKPLTVDKVCRIYVKVEYGTYDDWMAWINYERDPASYPKVKECFRILKDGTYKYIIKPENGLYQFKSKDWDDNYKNVIWNNNHKDESQIPVKDYINSVFDITWENDKAFTPIRWNVFGSINVDNLLEYSKEGISGQDLVCLIEEGADFWTINIPAGQWPEKELYKTGLYIVRVERSGVETLSAYETIIGPFANSVYPIVDNQHSLTAGIINDLKAKIPGLT